MLSVIEVQKEYVVVELLGKKQKILKKEYNKWCPIYVEKENTLWVNEETQELRYVNKKPSLKYIEYKKKYKLAHSLRDLEDSPNVKWYKLDKDGELRDISNVALFEVTLRQGIHTFIGLLE